MGRTMNRRAFMAALAGAAVAPKIVEHVNQFVNRNGITVADIRRVRDLLIANRVQFPMVTRGRHYTLLIYEDIIDSPSAARPTTIEKWSKALRHTSLEAHRRPDSSTPAIEQDS